jgi:hypothetical protein
MMLRVLVIAAGLVAAAAYVHPADADTIALLPLDGEKRLEIYGQPVAAEIGRALKAQGFDVVVVGAKMDVPDTAQLIVDGTIKADKKNAIALSIRIRDPQSGTTLETLPANAASLTTIDKAAADLSTRIGPAVRSHLDALAKAAQPEPKPPIEPTPRPPLPRVTHNVPPALPSLVVSVASPQGALPALGFLASGLTDELPRWSSERKRTASIVAPERMSRAEAIGTVRSQYTDVGIGLEVLTFTVQPGEVPLAKARVRVRVVHRENILFERVVRTDTIVGDKGITEQQLAARTAREVLAIVNAQLRRLVEGWR